MQKKPNTTVLFKDEHPYPFEINAKRLFILVLCSKGVSETTLHNKCIILFMEWDLNVSILVKIFKYTMRCFKPWKVCSL